MTIHRIVIVGAGPAGTTAAFELRAQGFEGELALVGAESHVPYKRPPLSKGFLRGETPDEKLAIKPQIAYPDARIDLELGRSVTRIDLGAGRVVLDDGRELPFDRLLLATGSIPRAVPVQGGELAGVHLLRRVGDSASIAADVVAGEPAAVIGGGWIGAEVAASLAQMGASVTLLTGSGLPLERTLGREIANAIADVHRHHGVRLVGGRLARIEGASRAEAVLLEDGTRLPVSLVVAGLGAEPDTRLAAEAGLSLARQGVSADARLQTNHRHIFVAGDIAEAFHPAYGKPVRVEHWDNAVQQGKHAARTMLGDSTPYTRRPFFYSDQFDLGLEYFGLAPDLNDVVLSGDPTSGSFSAFWLADGRIAAAMAVNDSDASERLGAIVDAAPAVDRGQLQRDGARIELQAVAAV